MSTQAPILTEALTATFGMNVLKTTTQKAVTVAGQSIG